MNKVKYLIVPFKDVPFVAAFRFEGQWWVKFSHVTGRSSGMRSRSKAANFEPNTLVGIANNG